MGLPATFLRLGDCNLTCQYCDTRYSWDWQHYVRRQELQERDVVEIASHLRALGPRRLVVTGGEPLLQLASLEDLLAELVDFFVEVETNGTLMPGPGLLQAVGQWNVSPKLSNSGMTRFLRIKPDVLAAFRDRQTAWLKLVVSEPEQMTEVEDIVSSLQWPNERVILMPQAINASELAARSSWLADVALNHGYRFSTRLQVLLWGSERGR
jgi:7-carboxy-7-deazaguanine synthase